MVNIDLIESVLNLLAKDCKIILVGDKNQLSPVNNCSIWNYLFENSDNSSIKSCVVNLEKTYRNIGDIALISSLIFNNDFSLLNQKIKELEKDNNSKEITISKSIEKDIPKDLLFSITSHLKQLNISTSNLSKKKYIFEKKKSRKFRFIKNWINIFFRESFGSTPSRYNCDNRFFINI